MTQITPTGGLTNLVIGDGGPWRILIVDDEETIRLALAKFLRSRGYNVETAESGPAALELLQRGKYVLMLCDVRMPGFSGVDVVSRALAIDADLAIVMLTAVNDAPTAAEVLSAGAMDYLMKPIELADLQLAIERALHRRGLAIERRNVERLIREEVVLRTAELERDKLALRGLTIDVVQSLVNALEAKDAYLRGHSQRVAHLAAAVAQDMELDEDSVEEIRLAGRLHDVGKIGIRESVLHKPGPLSTEEFDHVREHVRIGVDILSPLRHLGRTVLYVHDHHEHWDGSGYPRGLSGEAISIGGRILCAADAFDALTSTRPHRGALAPEATVHYLTAQSGTLLDPKVFEVLATVVRRGRALAFIDGA
ncbi:MAG TPA: HD domain-containing phosphohydrolase [Gemmatimonadaceae bacterium]|jgi:putative two-component system response regulator|nr:HD domain-containing phosphohydrolase [Gemmatimonadaceae bacterium]